MARPKKAINYAEEIQKIDMQITKWKKTIKELEVERQRLSEEKQRQELNLLYQAILESGKSVQEAAELFRSFQQTHELENAG